MNKLNDRFWGKVLGGKGFSHNSRPPLQLVAVTAFIVAVMVLGFLKFRVRL